MTPIVAEPTARPAAPTPAIATNLFAGTVNFPALLGASLAGNGGSPAASDKLLRSADPSADTQGDQIESALSASAEVFSVGAQVPYQMRYALPPDGNALPQIGNPIPPTETERPIAEVVAPLVTDPIIAGSAEGGGLEISASVQPQLPSTALAHNDERGAKPDPFEHKGSNSGVADKGLQFEKIQQVRHDAASEQPGVKAQIYPQPARSAETVHPVAAATALDQVASKEQDGSEQGRAGLDSANQNDRARAPALPKMDAVPVIASAANSVAATFVAAPSAAAADAALRVTLAQELQVAHDEGPRFAKLEKALGRSTEPPLHNLPEVEAETANPARIGAVMSDSTLQAPSQASGIATALSSSATLAQAVQSFAGQASPPAASALGAEPRGEVRPAQALDAIVDQLSEAREIGRAARPELTLRHHEFGAITMRIEAAGSDLRATLSSRDPGFVPAIQAALSERAAAIGETAAAQSQRGQDQGGNSGSNTGFHSGTGGFAERNYGSSPGSGQGSSQPYWDQSSGNETKRENPVRTGSADDNLHGSRDTGLFA